MLPHLSFGMHERNGIEIDVRIGYRMDVLGGKDVFQGNSSSHWGYPNKFPSYFSTMKQQNQQDYILLFNILEILLIKAQL